MLNQNVNEIQTVDQQTSWLVPTALLSPVAISIQFLEGFPILFSAAYSVITPHP